MQLPIKQLDHGKGLPLPTQGTPLSAGFDVCAAIEESITMKPGERSLIPCGFIMALPAGYEAQIRPRSGLALKHGITVLNAPGTIDADYRGELKVILINHSNCEFVIERGMRIAQMVVASVVTPEIVNVMVLPEIETTSCNAREAGGFGSTGFYSLTPESK